MLAMLTRAGGTACAWLRVAPLPLRALDPGAPCRCIWKRSEPEKRSSLFRPEKLFMQARTFIVFLWYNISNREN